LKGLYLRVGRHLVDLAWVEGVGAGFEQLPGARFDRASVGSPLKGENGQDCHILGVAFLLAFLRREVDVVKLDKDGGGLVRRDGASDEFCVRAQRVVAAVAHHPDFGGFEGNRVVESEGLFRGFVLDDEDDAGFGFDERFEAVHDGVVFTGPEDPVDGVVLLQRSHFLEFESRDFWWKVVGVMSGGNGEVFIGAKKW
jgi:hypothetical protein